MRPASLATIAASFRRPTGRCSLSGIAIEFVQDNQSLSPRRAPCAACTSRPRPLPRTSWCAWCADRCSTWRWTCAWARPPTAGTSTAICGGDLEPDPGADRLRARLHDARARHRGHLQGHQLLCPSDDRGHPWNDPDLGIAWPLPEAEAILSDKDKVQPRLRDLPDTFLESGLPPKANLKEGIRKRVSHRNGMSERGSLIRAPRFPLQRIRNECSLTPFDYIE